MSVKWWSASKYETCYYVECTPWGSSGGSHLVHCPRLMPMIGMGRPKVTPAPINKSIFINSPECPVAVASQISTQNYLTAMKPVGEFKEPHLDYGATIEVEPLDTFMQRCRIVLTVDQSVNHFPD